jgi:hypothetical protein
VSKQAAASRGIETLDLLNAFQGHEFCSKFDQQSTPFSRPTPATAEWGRFVGASTIQQGELQEAFHPDAYGQRALGTCVGKAATQKPGRFACSGAAGLDPSGLALARTASLSFPSASRCLARRSSIGTKGIGRLRLGATRRRLLSSPRLATVRPPATTSTRARYCVKASRGHVIAVFGKGAKVQLLAATVGRYGIRGVHPGTRLAAVRRRFRGLAKVSGTIYRLGRHSRRILGIRKGRVRYVGVATTRALRNRRALRTYVKRARL